MSELEKELLVKQGHVDKIDEGDSEEISNDELINRANRIWMYVAIGLLVVLIVVLIFPPFGTGNSTVATVNGQEITKNDLYDEMVKSNGAQSLDDLINNVLVQQEATDKGIKVTQKELDNELVKVKAGFGSDEEFQAALEQSKYSLETLKAQMKHEILVRKLLSSKVEVTEDEIKSYYNENASSFDQPEQVKASHILVETKAEAEAILAQLQDGADFAKLAKEKSIDDVSAANGGDLGYFGRGDMVPEFEAAAFALKNKGDLSAIVETSYGFHIIKLVDHKAASSETLDQAREDIKTQLINDKISDAFSTWITEVRGKSKIKNTLSSSK